MHRVALEKRQKIKNLIIEMKCAHCNAILYILHSKLKKKNFNFKINKKLKIKSKNLL